MYLEGKIMALMMICSNCGTRGKLPRFHHPEQEKEDLAIHWNGGTNLHIHLSCPNCGVKDEHIFMVYDK